MRGAVCARTPDRIAYVANRTATGGAKQKAVDLNALSMFVEFAIPILPRGAEDMDVVPGPL